MPNNNENCSDCGRQLTPFEIACIDEDHVEERVCPECYDMCD